MSRLVLSFLVFILPSQESGEPAELDQIIHEQRVCGR